MVINYSNILYHLDFLLNYLIYHEFIHYIFQNVVVVEGLYLCLIFKKNQQPNIPKILK